MTARVSAAAGQLAEFQGGILARWQVADRPGDLAAVGSLLRSGRWRTTYRAIYAAHTGPLARESVLWAAVLRCGPAAVLSHGTAAELDGLADRPGESVHVTIPGRERVWLTPGELRRGLPRIVVHRSVLLPATAHPARTPPRTRIEETVLDLTDAADSFDAAFGWMSTACGRRLVTADRLRNAASARSRLRWRNDVRVALEEIAQGVQSNLERGFVRNVERPHRLPVPKRQARLRPAARTAYLDNLYDVGLAVELDGLGAHPAETRWQDIHRDNRAAGLGIVTLRYSWADITCRPCEVAAEIAQVLRQRGWTGTLRACRPGCRAGRA